MESAVWSHFYHKATRIIRHFIQRCDIFKEVGSQDFSVSRRVKLIDGMISNANSCWNSLFGPMIFVGKPCLKPNEIKVTFVEINQAWNCIYITWWSLNFTKKRYQKWILKLFHNLTFVAAEAVSLPLNCSHRKPSVKTVARHSDENRIESVFFKPFLKVKVNSRSPWELVGWRPTISAIFHELVTSIEDGL